MLLDIVTFLGHLHPLVVHLPVGFLLLAFIFELASYIKKDLQLKQAIGFILLLGFIAAVLACIFGYLLSLNGLEYFKTSKSSTARHCPMSCFVSNSLYPKLMSLV